jgi:hypothetical protein
MLVPCAAFAVLQDFDLQKDPAACSSSLCTWNLHQLVCMLAVQAKHRGLTVHWLELWVERAMGWIKRRSRDRVVRDPGHLAVSVELDHRGVQRAAAVLGLYKSEEEEDGLPSTLLDSCSIGQLLRAPSSAQDCSLRAPAVKLTQPQWDDIQVGDDALNRWDCSAAMRLVWHYALVDRTSRGSC